MRRNPAGSIEQHISNRRSSAGNKRLMIFIERRITSDDGNRRERPSEMRASLSRADSAQKQQAQYEIFDKVACLADEMMHEE